MTTSWKESRDVYDTRFNKLATDYNIPQITQNLNVATANYISKGGLTQNSDPNVNPDYTDILKYSKEADDIKKKYIALNNDILRYIKIEATRNNLPDLLTENGTLQTEINGLHTAEKQIKTDVESAVARDELLRSRNTDISPHKLFLLDRPVRRNMIPYLWVLSVLCIGIALIAMRMILPSLGMTKEELMALSSDFVLMITSFFTNNVLFLSIIAALVVVIIVLSLVVGGVFR
jgi:hypothetical protein